MHVSPLHSSFCPSACVAEQSGNSNRIKCRKHDVPPGFSAPWSQEGLREGTEDLSCVILKKHKGKVDKGGEGEGGVQSRLTLQGWMEAEAPGASIRAPAKHIYCSTWCERLEGRRENKQFPSISDLERIQEDRWSSFILVSKSHLEPLPGLTRQGIGLWDSLGCGEGHFPCWTDVI